MAHLFVEIDGVERRPARQEVMAGGVAEVGCVRCRANIGGDAGFIDTDNIVPATLNQVVDDRRANDAAEPDNDYFRLLRKLCHFMRPHFVFDGIIVIGMDQQLSFYDIITAWGDRSLLVAARRCVCAWSDHVSS
ncbi:hypothetical protein FQZ97_1034730 [compost metagenome]